MAGSTKEELKEVWTRIAALEDEVRALKEVLAVQIDITDIVLRRHADLAAECVDEVIAGLPPLPEQSLVQTHLEYWAARIRRGASKNRERL